MSTPINYVRSFAALFIGFLVLMMIGTLGTALMIKVMSSPSANILLGVNLLSGLIAGYVAAALAGSRNLQHAFLLAGIILCVGLLALTAMKNAPRDDYSKYALFLSPVGIIIGGWLRHRKSA